MFLVAFQFYTQIGFTYSFMRSRSGTVLYLTRDSNFEIVCPIFYFPSHSILLKFAFLCNEKHRFFDF